MRSTIKHGPRTTRLKKVALGLLRSWHSPECSSRELREIAKRFGPDSTFDSWVFFELAERRRLRELDAVEKHRVSVAWTRSFL